MDILARCGIVRKKQPAGVYASPPQAVMIAAILMEIQHH